MGKYQNKERIPARYQHLNTFIRRKFGVPIHSPTPIVWPIFVTSYISSWVPTSHKTPLLACLPTACSLTSSSRWPSWPPHPKETGNLYKGLAHELGPREEKQCTGDRSLRCKTFFPGLEKCLFKPALFLPYIWKSDKLPIFLYSATSASDPKLTLHFCVL